MSVNRYLCNVLHYNQPLRCGLEKTAKKEPKYDCILILGFNIEVLWFKMSFSIQKMLHPK